MTRNQISPFDHLNGIGAIRRGTVLCDQCDNDPDGPSLPAKEQQTSSLLLRTSKISESSSSELSHPSSSDSSFLGRTETIYKP